MTPYEAATQAAEQLQGTCNAIYNLGPEFEELQNNDVFCARLDELVFCCTVCEWWREQSEMSENEDWICNECAATNDDN